MAVIFGKEVVIIFLMKSELSGLTAVFDLDGTLVADCFPTEVKRLSQSISKAIGVEINPDEFLKTWKERMKHLMAVHEVDPVISSMACGELLEKYGLNCRDGEGKRIFLDFLKILYNDPIVALCEGAIPAIEAAGEGDRQVLIGTIAKKGWTDRKLVRSGLKQFFTNGNVFCFDIHVHKKFQWESFLSHYGLSAEEMFIVGDTYAADIEPLLALGVKRAFWVNNGKISDEEFLSREAPETVTKLLTVGELADLLK